MLINQVLLHVQWHRVESPKATIIIVHGIAEHSGRYQKLVSFLNRASYQVVTFDLRGHGQSQGKRGDIQSFHQYVDDIHEIVQAVRLEETHPVFILGHSLGGILSLIYATKYDDIDGLITSGAPSDYVKDVKPLRIIGVHILKRLKKKTNFADDKLSRIREVESDYMNDPLNLSYFYFSVPGQVLVKGVGYFKKRYALIKIPILMLHGGDDKIVPASFSEETFKRIASEDKTLKIYPESYHEILNDLDQDTVMSDIKAWLDAHI